MFNEKLKHFLKHFLIYVMTLSFVTAFLVSCVHPVQASAESFADEFNDALRTELERYNDAYEVALATSVLTPEVPTWAMALEFYGLMNTYEYLNFTYFDNPDSAVYNVPNTPGTSGCYYFVDNTSTTKLRLCNISSPTNLHDGGLCVAAQDFSITYTYGFSGSIDIDLLTISFDTNQNGVINIAYPPQPFALRSFNATLTSDYGTYTKNRQSTSQYLDCGYKKNLQNYIPTFRYNELNNIRILQEICGRASDFVVPSGNISRDEPWKYYNDLIDDCHDKYGDTETVNDWLPWHGQKWVPGHVGPYDPTEPDRPNPIDIPSILPGVPYVPGTPTEIPVEIDTNGTTEIYEVYSPTTNQITINGVAFIIGAGAFGAAGVAGAAGGIYANGQISIGGELFDIPSFDLPIDGFDVPISIPDSNTIQLGDLEFHFNPDGTITIGDMTFNLPLGEPETIEAGAETYLIEYELPTFETLYVPAETVPQISLSNYYDGITLLWDAVYDLLDNTGFLPLVYIMFGMGVVAYIMWKIGG